MPCYSLLLICLLLIAVNCRAGLLFSFYTLVTRLKSVLSPLGYQVGLGRTHEKLIFLHPCVVPLFSFWMTDMELSQLSEILKNFLLRYDLSTWAVVCEEGNDRILIQRKFNKHSLNHNHLPPQSSHPPHTQHHNNVVDPQSHHQQPSQHPQHQQQQQQQRQRPADGGFVNDDRRMNHYPNFPPEAAPFVGQPGGAFKTPPRHQDLQHSQQCDSQSRNHPHGNPHIPPHQQHPPPPPPPPQHQQQQPHSQLALESAVDCRDERRNFADGEILWTKYILPVALTPEAAFITSSRPSLS